MRVVKVLNTSVVLALDDNGEEIILMGKGIGFRKSVGEKLDAEVTDKIFVLRDRNVTRNIIQLTLDVDADVFGLAKEIIDYAKTQYHMQLMDHIYLALTDHLAFTIRRVKEDIFIPGFYSLSIKRYNPAEYDVGCYALRLIREELGVEIPEGEISNIAFHFINAQKDHPYNSENRKMDEIVNGALDIVKYAFALVYNTDSVAYSRFVTHLHALAQRVVLGKQLSEDMTDFLYGEIVPNCPAEFRCAGKIAKFIFESYRLQISRQEQLYLTIHIHRILEEHKHLP